MLGDPQVLLLDEPGNGLDPEGIRWVRTFMRQLAAEGRTVFVSSHLMSEMSVLADHLIVIGRGKLIANSSTTDFIQSSSERSVLVRTPDAGRLRALLAAEGGTVTEATPDGTAVNAATNAAASASSASGSAAGASAGGNGTSPALIVTGLEAPRIGELAASAQVVLHELTPRLPSLEEAFMELTADSVEYGRGPAGAPPAPQGANGAPASPAAPGAPAQAERSLSS
jgi:ABC-2 type transport system ATP-binding protein